MKKILSLALLLALMLFVGISSKKEVSKESLEIQGGSFIEGLRILGRDEETLLWSLTSNTASLDGRLAHLKAVRINFPQRGLNINAEKGRYNMDSNDLFLVGNIKAQTKDYTITTDSVKLLSGRRLFTDDRVIVEGKRLKIEGQGMSAEKNVWILRNVNAIFF